MIEKVVSCEKEVVSCEKEKKEITNKEKCCGAK